MRRINLDKIYVETANLLRENIELKKQVSIYEKLIEYMMEQNMCLKLLIYLYRNNLVEDIGKFLETNTYLPRNIDEDTLYQAIKCKNIIKTQ